MMAVMRTLAARDSIASASTTDLGSKDATFLTITGTTGISSFGTVSEGIYKFVTFAGALTITHNATSMILHGGTNRTTAAGDCGLYLSLGSSNWKEVFFQGDFVQSGVGAVARSIQSKLGEAISVKDFGAKGDGVTNDHAAIAAAVIAARGKNLYFPEGQYLINTDGGSITLEEVGLIGEFVQDGATGAIDQGTVLRFTGTTNSPFLVRRGVTIKQIGFYYPNQADSATPVAYPPTLDFDFTNGSVQFVYIEDNVVFNAYRFLRINDVSGNVGHVWVSNNTIYGIHRAIEIAHNLEVIKMRGNTFTFGHWLAATESGCRGYTRSNGHAVQYDHGDGFWFTDNLIFGYLRGISIAGGQAILSTIDGNMYDQVRYSIHVSGSGNFQQSNISNNLFLPFNNVDTTQAGIAIYLQNTSTADSLNITGNHFGTCTDSHIVADGAAAGKLVITGNIFESMGHAQTSGSHAAISLNCAAKTVMITGNHVTGQGNAYTYGVLCYAANVLHVGQNVFQACNVPLNVITAGQVTSVGNASYATVAATSDVLTTVTGEVWQVGNRWDKPGGVSTRPAFLVQKNASQTFNSGTATDVTWGSEVFDKGADFATPSFTAPYRGRYRFSWGLLHDNTGTAGDRWNILLTSPFGVFSQSYKMIADYNSVSGDGMLELNAGDTMKLQIQRVGGAGNFVTFNDSSANFFCGELVE